MNYNRPFQFRLAIRAVFAMLIATISIFKEEEASTMTIREIIYSVVGIINHMLFYARLITYTHL